MSENGDVYLTSLYVASWSLYTLSSLPANSAQIEAFHWAIGRKGSEGRSQPVKLWEQKIMWEQCTELAAYGTFHCICGEHSPLLELNWPNTAGSISNK